MNISHVYKTKLGFTLKKCRNNQYLLKSTNQQKIHYGKGGTLKFQLQCYCVRKLPDLFRAPLTSVRTLCKDMLANTNHNERNFFLSFPSKYVITTET